MNPASEIRVKFYENLGKLFYAVAAADRVVRPEEVNRLKEIVRSEWLKFDEVNDDFDTDAAYRIEVVFDWLQAHNADAETCIHSFELFKQKHPSLFTEKGKEMIWKTLNSIASSFAGRNKSELIMLNKISHLFVSAGN